jgi:hypothetical protein
MRTVHGIGWLLSMTKIGSIWICVMSFGISIQPQIGTRCVRHTIQSKAQYGSASGLRPLLLEANHIVLNPLAALGNTGQVQAHIIEPVGKSVKG